MGAVVVEDGAGAVDDFLVALDLRHDLLLHLQRRQGDLEFLDVRPIDRRENCACISFDVTVNLFSVKQEPGES